MVQVSEVWLGSDFEAGGRAEEQVGTEAGGSGLAEAQLGTGRGYMMLARQQLRQLKPEPKWKTSCPEELHCACCLKPVWWMLLLVLLLLADHPLGLHSWQMKKTGW